MFTQVGEHIYYEACRDITEGSELLVWYGDTYVQFMGIPVSMTNPLHAAQTSEVESKPHVDYTDTACACWEYIRD